MALGNLILIFCYLGLTLVVSCVGQSKLQIRKDIFLWIFVIQAAFYLWVNPSLMVAMDPTLAANYQNYQFLTFAFFLFPLLLVYRLLSGRPPSAEPTVPGAYLTDGRIFIFAGALLTFEILFLFFAFKYEMIFRRIGFEALAVRQASLPPLALLVIRSHDLLVLPCLSFLVYLLTYFNSPLSVSRRGWWVLLALFAVQTTAFVGNSLLNSRSILLSGIIFTGATFLYFYKKPIPFRKLAGPVFLIAPVCLYGLVLISNIRTYQSSYHDRWTEALSPFYSRGRVSQSVQDRDWIQRLDCLSFANRMEPAADAFGRPGFVTWRVPALIAATQFVAPALSHEYKTLGRTTAKYFLLSQYTSLDPTDYPTCVVSDVWGSFGVGGLLAGGLLLALLFGTIRFLLRGTSKNAVLVGLFLAAHLFLFEQEFISVLVGWVKWLPAFAGLLIINPISVRKVSGG